MAYPPDRYSESNPAPRLGRVGKVGEPIPLTPPNLRRLIQRRPTHAGAHVRDLQQRCAGYRIPEADGVVAACSDDALICHPFIGRKGRAEYRIAMPRVLS